MTLGRGIFLMTLGLILALGVRDRVGAIDLSVIGWILTGVGLLVFTLALSSARRGRRASRRSSTNRTTSARSDRSAAGSRARATLA